MTMSRDKIYNFSAGPSVLPEEALLKAQSELCDYRSSGMSVMELSHRSALFDDILCATKSKLAAALKVPEDYEILFLQGGATLQFASIPLNLMKSGRADYAVTGHFSAQAAKEAAKYGSVNIACSSADRGHSYIPAQGELECSQDADYFYYCANNTIFGTEWQYVPQTGSVPLVCDMSSDILSRPVKVSDYGLIYAGAQKNMAPAGLTVVVLKKELAGSAMAITPSVMDYKTLIDKNSMLNTPPCWCIYMLGLVLDWLGEQGGVKAMEELRNERSRLVYDFLDNSSVLIPHAEAGSRSGMNVTFRTKSAELDAEFISGAQKAGLLNLKGHRLTGGMRASMYNAMPIAGAAALVEYMKKFEVEHRV